MSGDGISRRRATDYDAIINRSELRRDEKYRGDNVTAWEERCEPVIRLLRRRPLTLTELRLRCRRETGSDTAIGANVAEECLYWLEARGRVVRGDDRKWRLV